MKVMTKDGLQTLPRRWSFWRHANGNIYQVFAISNLSDRQARYPATVHYVGPNGKEWSKRADEWFDKMTPLTDVLDQWLQVNEGQILTRERVDAFRHLWRGMMQQAGDGDNVIDDLPTQVFDAGEHDGLEEA